MKRTMLAALGLVMLGCQALPAPQPKLKPVASVQHPTQETCRVIYWHMVGIAIRDAEEPGHHYENEELDAAIVNLHKQYVVTGVTQQTMDACMQLNLRQTDCMQTAMTFEAINDCEERFATPDQKKDKQ